MSLTPLVGFLVENRMSPTPLVFAGFCNATLRWLRILLLLATSLTVATAYGDEKVFRTGLEADRADIAASPDGKRILFDTNRLDQGLRLLNVSSGEMRIIPPEAGRTIGFPSWSPDGRKVAVVSAAVPGGYYSVDDMKIVLLDADSWQPRNIANGDGVKFSPFFSHDGKTVYYFKGKKRESGKTPANRYDLIAIDVAKGEETSLTHEEFAAISKGDDAPNSLVFSATPNFSKRFKDALGQESNSALFLFDKGIKTVAPIKVDQSSRIFGFFKPRRDRMGNLYFITAKARPGGGNFLWYLVRSDKDGNLPQLLTELPISMGFDIARNTGDIYVMGRNGNELIIRKLAAKAAI